MKKQLHLLFIAMMFLYGANVMAQCTPNSYYADSSATIRPDTLNFSLQDFACHGHAYDATITIKTTTDTTVNFNGSMVPFHVLKFKILSVTGMPAGFAYTPNVPEWDNGGTVPNQTAILGCVGITADSAHVSAANTTSSPITYPISILADAYVQIHGSPNPTGWASQLQPPGLKVPGYKIIVYPASATQCATGILEYSPDRFSVISNYPNPFSKTTEIKYTVPTTQEMEFKVYNMLGKLIEQRKVVAITGENIIKFNGEKLSSGIYMYSISNGKETIVKKMVVN